MSAANPRPHHVRVYDRPDWKKQCASHAFVIADMLPFVNSPVLSGAIVSGAMLHEPQERQEASSPFTQEKMRYQAKTGSIIYRSKMHPVLKRNFEVFSALDWLAALTAHIPNHGEHLVRYYGWYSNVSRGKRKKAQPDGSTAAAQEVVEVPYRKSACFPRRTFPGPLAPDGQKTITSILRPVSYTNGRRNGGRCFSD